MSLQQPDELVDALRADMCGADKQAEVKARLVARGVLRAGAATVATASAVAHAQATVGAIANGATGASVAATGKILTWTASSKLLLSFALASAATIGTVSLSRMHDAPEPAPTAQKRPMPALAKRVEASLPIVEQPRHEAQGSEVAEPIERQPANAEKPRGHDTLKQESALLMRAAESIHARDFSRAEQQLDRHEQTYPDGILRQERELARRRLRRERDADRP
jgi:hypothetical protein